MTKTVVINIVGLTKSLIDSRMPFFSEWVRRKHVSTINPMLPAVTCSVQTTYLTGKWPNDHGIIGNGWFHQDYQEIKFWHQSNKLVQSPYIWDRIKERHPDFKVANMFWWFNMHSSADISVTPRPQYRTNGLKVPDCYSVPSSYRDALQHELGQFPLFDFWGPKTSIKSSQWISNASQLVHEWSNPDLMLIYLPHLDYVLQKYGPEDSPQLTSDLVQLDKVCQDLIQSFEQQGVNVAVLSEYGVTKVDQVIYLNQALRRKGLVSVREENGLELLDAGASEAFAVVDHQIAHIYVKNKTNINHIKRELQNISGIADILDKEGQEKHHINHDRSGDLVAISDASSWFSYYYWLDDACAPDFSRTVAIHQKPGYDPVELFFDSEKKWLLPRMALKLMMKKIGFRTLFDFIPLNSQLVKGSHGQIGQSISEHPIFIGDKNLEQSYLATSVASLISQEIFG